MTKEELNEGKWRKLKWGRELAEWKKKIESRKKRNRIKEQWKI